MVGNGALDGITQDCDEAHVRELLVNPRRNRALVITPSRPAATGGLEDGSHHVMRRNGAPLSPRVVAGGFRNEPLHIGRPAARVRRRRAPVVAEKGSLLA